MFMYYVYRVATSTAPLYNNTPTKLIGICKVKAKSSVEACDKARKHFNIDNEVIVLAHQSGERVIDSRNPRLTDIFPEASINKERPKEWDGNKNNWML